MQRKLGLRVRWPPPPASALVHDEMAEVHERMKGFLLDPTQLRRHAEAQRLWADQESEAADKAEREAAKWDR